MVNEKKDRCGFSRPTLSRIEKSDSNVSIGDSAPLRFGRMLMRRAESVRAKSKAETARTLSEVDYLLDNI